LRSRGGERNIGPAVLFMSRMPHRRLFVTVLAIAALSSGSALADDPSDPVELGAELSSCETGASGDDRVAVFSGAMPADGRAARLGMMFALEERRAGEDDYARVKLPSFGSWQKSATGVSGYVVDKRVEQLVPGASYRVVVRFRWYAKGGKVLRSAKRTSTACKQPEARRAPTTAKS
jgi:hypothetical protein